MKEHIYKASPKRIVAQSFSIWLFVLFQFGLNVLAAETLISRGDLWALIVINLVLAAVNVPAILLFWKYYRHSAGKQFVVTFTTLKYSDTKSGVLIELNTSEITRIKLIQTPKLSRLPWFSHEYFMLSDSRNNSIIVTSYIMNIHEFWLDSLTRKVDSNKLIKEEKTLPIF